MKKTLIATAVAVSVVAPISAFAVNSGADDTGEALIFPYYNVNQGNQSFIGVVNTTNQVKVLKVRFREGVESEDIFDFQLWLSPHDHWTAVIGQTAAGQVRVSTADLSCTVPQVFGNTSAVFNPTRIPAVYTGDRLARISEGHAEVIEMATVSAHALAGIGQLATAVTHVNGVPANCSAAAIFNNQGYVIRTPGDYQDNGLTPSWGGHFEQPTGGVYGIAAVFNPNDGTYFTYTAEALEQFAATPIFYPQTQAVYEPGPDHTADQFLSSVEVLAFDLPDISTPDSVEGGGSATIESRAFAQNGVVTVGTYTTDATVLADNAGATSPGGSLSAAAPTDGNAPEKKRDAVTTALMGVRVFNDYLTGDLYDTDWAFTFPGRYLYRDAPIPNTNLYPMEAPFQSTVDRTTGRGCETFDTNILYGREEEQLIGDNIDFSPGDAPDVFALCYEVNVISINDPAPLGTPSGALGSIAVRANAGSTQLFGWADLGMENHSLTDDNNVVHLGMPVVGFAAITERKGLVDRGGAFMHKITRGVTQ